MTRQSSTLALPVGYRFCPTDSELIQHYLKGKNSSLPFSTDVIKEIDVYKYNPWDLQAAFQSGLGKHLYFFTQRDRKYPKGNRPQRIAGDGYWKASGRVTLIRDESENVTIGYKRHLVFYRGQHKKSEKTNWLMHEYSLHESFPSRHPMEKEENNTHLDGFVISEIYENKADGGSAKLGNSKIEDEAFGFHDQELAAVSTEDGGAQDEDLELLLSFIKQMDSSSSLDVDQAVAVPPTNSVSSHCMDQAMPVKPLDSVTNLDQAKPLQPLDSASNLYVKQAMPVHPPYSVSNHYLDQAMHAKPLNYVSNLDQAMPPNPSDSFSNLKVDQAMPLQPLHSVSSLCVDQDQAMLVNPMDYVDKLDQTMPLHPLDSFSTLTVDQLMPFQPLDCVCNLPLLPLDYVSNLYVDQAMLLSNLYADQTMPLQRWVSVSNPYGDPAMTPQPLDSVSNLHVD